MNFVEQLKKKYLIYCLDEPFTLHDIAWTINVKLKGLKEDEIKKITIEVIKYFLENDLFFIGDMADSGTRIDRWKFNLDECIKNLNSLLGLGLGSEKLWVVHFDLTKKGKNEAIEYLNKNAKAKEEIIKECFEERRVSINFVLILVKDVFQINDSEEIVEEAVYALDFLIDSDFINIVYESTWHNIKYDAIETSKFLREELMKIVNGFELENNLFIQNTSPTNALVKMGKKCGGRLVDDWYEAI